MANRMDFTTAVKDLLAFMQSEGDFPILDYALRSKDEQKRLYELGKSTCDGEVKVSKHQLGLAVDIYFYNPLTHNLDFDRGKADKYHEFWISLGGKPMIEWDQGHYEF